MRKQKNKKKVFGIILKILLVLCIGICTHLTIVNHFNLKRQLEVVEEEVKQTKALKNVMRMKIINLERKVEILYNEIHRVEGNLEKHKQNRL